MPPETEQHAPLGFGRAPSDKIRELRPWPRTKWLALAAFFFAFQVLFFYLLLDSKTITPRQASIQQNIQLISPVTLDSNPALAALIHSAALEMYAYPNKEGISSFLWKTPSTTDYTPAPPAFPFLSITPDQELFGRDLSNILMNTTTPIEPQENFYSPTTKIREQTARSPITQSSIRLPDSSQPHWKLPPIELPSQTYSGSLADSVILASVGTDGRIFTATLISSCGLKSADQDALRIVDSLQLLPVNPAPNDIPFEPNSWKTVQILPITLTWATISPQKTTPTP